MKRVSQSAVEYMFMLAAALVIVLFVTVTVLRVVREVQRSVQEYISTVRRQLLENL